MGWLVGAFFLFLFLFFLIISTFNYYLFIYLFIYFWLHWAIVAAQVAVSGGCSSCGAQASHCSGFSCCRAQALGARASVAVAHGLSIFDTQAQ